MGVDSKKLHRLVKAQETLESLARTCVVRCTFQLKESEAKLAQAEQAPAATAIALIFADMRMRHIQKLMELCAQERSELEIAQGQLSIEVSRGEKLRERLRNANVSAARNADGLSVLEQLSRPVLDG